MLKKNQLYTTIFFVCLVPNVHGGFLHVVSDSMSHLVYGFFTPTIVTRGIEDDQLVSESTAMEKHKYKDIYDEEDLTYHKNGLSWMALKKLTEKWKNHLEEWQNKKAQLKHGLWELMQREFDKSHKQYLKLDEIIHGNTAHNTNKDDKNEHSHTEERQEKK